MTDDPAEGEGGQAGASPRPGRGTGRRLRGAVARQLGVAIVSGEYAPGDTLSGEIAFSEALDVSRSAYREAVQVLTAKGLIASRTKSGTRVLPRSRWNLLDPDVLAWAFAGEPDPGFVRDLFELRTVVEPAAARFAAERRDSDDLAAMDDALTAMRRHTLAVDRGQAADRDFHEAVLRAARNEALLTLSASIGAAISWTTRLKHRARTLPRDPITDHVRVRDAIAVGDPAAADAAMRALIDSAFRDTRLALKD